MNKKLKYNEVEECEKLSELKDFNWIKISNNSTSINMIVSLQKIDFLNNNKVIVYNNYVLKFENCDGIYKDIIVTRDFIDYYIKLFKNSKTKAEVYNTYLFAEKLLKIGDEIKIEYSPNKFKNGIIEPLHKDYYGIYYRLKTALNDMGDIKLLLDNNTKFNNINKTIINI